jgi:hypothetical protein
MKKLLAVLVFLCMLLSLKGFSQEKKDTLYRVVTNDGNEYVGKIVSRDADAIVLSTTQLGNITIRTVDIKSIRSLTDVRMEKGKIYFDYPQASKYFISQSAYGVKKGEGYYSNAWIFFNEVTYGVTNNFSITAGIVPLFLFSGAETPVWINPKLSIPLSRDKVNIAVGAYVGTVLGLEESNFAFLYGNSTFGNRDKNITLGLGWGVAGGEVASTPLITVAGMLRISQRWYLLTENQFLNLEDGDGISFISGGARYAARKLGIDFGLFLPLTEDAELFALPWLGINVPFGKAK